MKSKTKKVKKKTPSLQEVFAKASKAKQRVMIAQDALNRVKLGQYNPAVGSWAIFNMFQDTEEQSLQKLILDNKTNCQCCALGGIMASCIVFKNNFTKDKLDGMSIEFPYKIFTEDIYDEVPADKLKLDSIFTKKQLLLIEAAFEQGSGGLDNYYDKSDTLHHKAVSFGYQYRFSEERFVAIMQNIIENKGTFRP